MTDIVERLRAHKVPQMHEAAAEIERLRDEVERLSGANDQVWADNERLRAALDTVRASGLLIGSTTLHDRVRSAVYNAIDALAEEKP
jgi:hypothetical protein